MKEMWLNRLPGDYRRRYYTNLAIFVGLIIILTNAWRLGPHGLGYVILGLFGLAIMCAFVLPFVRLAKANPKPGSGAFIFCGSWVAAYVYVAASAFSHPHLPATFLVQTVGFVLMLAFLITYRKIVFPDFFGGQVRERWTTIRAAQRASRGDMDLFTVPSQRPEDPNA